MSIRPNENGSLLPSAEYFCRVCELNCNTSHNLEAHLKGKKHLLRLEAAAPQFFASATLAQSAQPTTLSISFFHQNSNLQPTFTPLQTKPFPLNIFGAPNVAGTKKVRLKKAPQQKHQTTAFNTISNLQSFSFPSLVDAVTLPPPPPPPPPPSNDDRSIQSTSYAQPLLFAEASSDGLIVKVSNIDSCYMCVSCTARFTSQSDGIRHVNKTKHWERKMTNHSRLCGNIFSLEKMIDLSARFQLEFEGMVFCILCNERFNSGDEYNDVLHLYSLNHLQRFRESSDGQFYCSPCDINFMGENAVANHRKTNAHLTRMLKDRLMCVNSIDPFVGLPENFTCDCCEMTSDTMEAFRQHIFDTSHDKLLHQRRIDDLKQKKAIRKAGRKTPPATVSVDPWMPSVDNFAQSTSSSIVNGSSVEEDSSSTLNFGVQAALQPLVADYRTSTNCVGLDSLNLIPKKRLKSLFAADYPQGPNNFSQSSLIMPLNQVVAPLGAQSNFSKQPPSLLPDLSQPPPPTVTSAQSASISPKTVAGRSITSLSKIITEGNRLPSFKLAPARTAVDYHFYATKINDECVETKKIVNGHIAPYWCNVCDALFYSDDEKLDHLNNSAQHTNFVQLCIDSINSIWMKKPRKCLWNTGEFFPMPVSANISDSNISFSASVQTPSVKLSTATVADQPFVETEEYQTDFSFFNPSSSSINSSSKSKPKPVAAQLNRNSSDVPVYQPRISVFGSGDVGRGSGVPKNASSMINGADSQWLQKLLASTETSISIAQLQCHESVCNVPSNLPPPWL